MQWGLACMDRAGADCRLCMYKSALWLIFSGSTVPGSPTPARWEGAVWPRGGGVAGESRLSDAAPVSTEGGLVRLPSMQPCGALYPGIYV